MKIVRRIVLAIYAMLEILVGSLLTYMMIALVCSIIPVGGGQNEVGVKIYIKTNGIHTDICMPVENEWMNWKDFIPVSDFPNAKAGGYISIGWGDKGFFLDTPTWDDLTFNTAFTAAFLPSPTAMHVQYLDSEPVVSSVCEEAYVSPEKYIDLVDFIKETFSLKTNQQVDLIPNKGYWHNDNFYEAHGSYHLFNTCNAWTNRALKVAGVRTALLALFSDGIMRHLR